MTSASIKMRFPHSKETNEQKFESGPEKTKLSFWRRHHGLSMFLLFLSIVCISFMMRTYHYNSSVVILNDQIGEVPVKERQTPSFFRSFFPFRHNNFSPFTIESAMMFGYAQDIATGKGVPEHDVRLKHLEDLPPYAQMNMGLEWFLGWGWRIKNAIVKDPEASPREKMFQDYPYMAQWMSGQIRLWASSISGLIFLWLLLLRCPAKLAYCGGLLHAVAPAAIARATGQDLVRGEFCIPLIIATFVLMQWIVRKPKWWKYPLIFLTSFLAFITWDLCQMLFSCWGLMEILYAVFGYRSTKAKFFAWCCVAAAILLNALFVPFNVTYCLIHAPIIWAVLPTVLLCTFWGLLEHERPKIRKWKRWFRIAVIPVFALLYGLWIAVGNTQEYHDNYKHFSEAMKAKLQYNNVKPSDSSKLSYDARIMWTPSMHSATWDIATTFFPSFIFGKQLNFGLFRFLFGDLPLTLSFYFILLIGLTLFSIPKRTFIRSLPRTLFPHVFTVGFLIGFIYIVRYHEFLILFLSLALPLLLQSYLRAFRYFPAGYRKEEAYTALYLHPRFMGVIRKTLIFIFSFLLLWEFLISLSTKRRYTGDIALKETAQLIMWFRTAKDHVKNQGVAGTMTIEPMLFAYAGTGVVMNPQFGMKRIRDCTEDYLNTIFHGNETDLAKYCGKHDVKYIVYNKGATFSTGIYSNRYIANAQVIENDSMAYRFLNTPDSLYWFCRIAPPRALASSMNRVYTVFRYISPEEKRKAIELSLEARRMMLANDVKKARQLTKEAFENDPVSPAVGELYYDICGDFPTLTLSGVE